MGGSNERMRPHRRASSAPLSTILRQYLRPERESWKLNLSLAAAKRGETFFGRSLLPGVLHVLKDVNRRRLLAVVAGANARHFALRGKAAEGAFYTGHTQRADRSHQLRAAVRQGEAFSQLHRHGTELSGIRLAVKWNLPCEFRSAA